MDKLSVFITTFNNAETLPACLEAVRWADEIVLLDSFSTDETMAIAKRYGCRTEQHRFLGYGPQKQMALGLTNNDYALLLDADEVLSGPLQAEIQALRERGFSAAGYTIARWEQLFWRMPHRSTRKNFYLRLFDKRRARVTDMPVHAAPEVDGPIERLEHPFYHFGETDIHTKVDKINGYSSGLVREKVAKGKRANPWVLVFYPPFFFARSYFFKRGFLNGWAGFIASAVASFYVFLKYAKLYEHRQFEEKGDACMPDNAPPLRPPAERHGGPV